MVLVDPKSKPRATWTFAAEIWTFDGLTKMIKNNYQPVIHVGHVRQSARFILDKKLLNTHEDESTKRTTSIDEFHKSNPTSSEEEEKMKSKAVKSSYFSEDATAKIKGPVAKTLSPSSDGHSPKNTESKKVNRRTDEFNAVSIFDKDILEEI